MNSKTKILIFSLFLLILVVSSLFPLTGCANRGIGPQGGPKDTLAPVITKTTIPNGARNVKAKNMVIQFNEYIQINGSTENILVSPPQQRPPEIKAVGKRIEINFQEDLLDSTTYTIDFGNQIVDNNEKNPIPNYAFAFSTGDQIDSLEIYGQLINAEDLNPISGVVIGLHQDVNDSAFYHHPFTRIARTNEEGEFAIRNIKAGTYRLFALQDQSRDYCFQPGEGLAFQDELITPYITTEIITDTIFLQDTVDILGNRIADSIITSEYFYYEPSELLLRFFKEDYKRLYFQRAFRKEAHRIQLVFNGHQPQIPRLTAVPLDGDSLPADWVDFTQHSIILASSSMDTFSIWLTDSLAIGLDSIRFAMSYYKTDSVFNTQLQTDTILSVYRAPRLTERAQKALEQKRDKKGLPLAINNTKFNQLDTLLLYAASPIDRCYKDSIHLLMKKDTLLMDVPFDIQRVDSSGLALMILTKWSANQDYKLKLDSGAIYDIYAMTNKADQFGIHVRSDEEYASMTVYLHPYRENAYIQLLNEKDVPIRVSKAQPEGALFTYLEPGVYYMRVFMDENEDGRWTTGDFSQHRQPEQVYYFHKKLTLRANWVFEEHFDWTAIPLLQQKPAAIRKDITQKKK